MFRRSLLSVRQAAQRRNFSSDHGHEKVKYEGLEAKIRTYFPEQHEMVLATLGMYAGLFVTYKAYKFVFPSKPVVKVAAPVNNDADQSIPSITDEKFQAWSQIPGNMQKWEASLEAWAKNA